MMRVIVKFLSCLLHNIEKNNYTDGLNTDAQKHTSICLIAQRLTKEYGHCVRHVAGSIMALSCQR